MDRSSKHQPSKALNNPANHPLDPKVLREQSRSHLARKNQKELESQMGYNVPYGMATMNPYLMMNPMVMGPMGMTPWMMGYPAPALPGNITGIDMANPQSTVEQSFVAQTAPIQATQPPSNVMQAQGNQYASMPMPVYGYPHQMPLVPLQHVQAPQGGFYPMYAQQPYQPQLASQDTANAMSMIASTIKRKFFGLTYPPVGNATPKPKMLSVETWKKIREAQKTLRHNWQSEMKLKEKPSDSERRHSGNTLDDLFGDAKASKKKPDDKTTRYVQVDMLQAPNPISIQADFAYDYNQEIHVPVSNDIACIINGEKSQAPQSVSAQPAVEQPVIVPSIIESAVMEQPIVDSSTVEQAIVENIQQKTLPETTEAIQDDNQGMAAPTVSSDAAMTLSEPVEIEQIPVLIESLAEPLVVASIQEDTTAQEITQPVVTSEINIENKQVIESAVDGNTVTKSQVEVRQQQAPPNQAHVNEGLDELFTDASFEDMTAGWKPYSSKPAKAKQNIPISISKLKQEELPASTQAESSIWSKMVSVVQKCLIPTDTVSQNMMDQQVAQPVHNQPKPMQDDFARLQETMASLQQDVQEEGINTYAMWQQYKQLEGKMNKQKRVIHDLLTVQESFDDNKLDYCYLPQFADNETFVSDLDADMARDLGLGSFDEIKASVESRHPSLTTSIAPVHEKNEAVQPEIPMPQPAIRHVDVEVIPSEAHRHYQASANDVYKNRVLNSIKNTSTDQGIETVIQQQRQNVDIRKASLDAAVKEALVYTPTSEEVISAAMNRHMMGMQGVQSQYARGQAPQEGTYSMETTVRVEYKQPGREPVSMMHRVQEDFTVQSMLQSNRMLSNSISSLADEYFKHASEEEI